MKNLFSILILCFLSTFMLAENIGDSGILLDSLPFKGSGVQYFNRDEDVDAYTPDSESYGSEIAYSKNSPNCYFRYNYQTAAWIKNCSVGSYCEGQDSIYTENIVVNNNTYSIIYQLDNLCNLVTIDTVLREVNSSGTGVNLGTADLNQTDISRFYTGQGEASGSSLNWRDMTRFSITNTVGTYQNDAKTVNLGNEILSFNADSIKYGAGKEPQTFTNLPFLQGIDAGGNIRKIASANLNAETEKVPLIVIFGESNSSLYAENSHAKLSELTAKPNLQIYNPNVEVFQDLQIGENSTYNASFVANGFDTLRHGVELHLANEGFFSLGVPQVFLVKAGQGGSRAAEWGVGSFNYLALIDRVEKSIELIENSGKKAELVFWFSLGVNDANDGANYNAWKTLVQSLFAQIRIDLVKPNAPFIVTHLVAEGKGTIANQDSLGVRIDEIAAEDSLVFAIPSGVSHSDNSHWNYNGFKIITQRLINATVQNNLISTGTYSVINSNVVESKYMVNAASLTGAFVLETDLQLPIISTERMYLFLEIDIYDYNKNLYKNITTSAYLSEGAIKINRLLHSSTVDAGDRIRFAIENNKLVVIVLDESVSLSYSYCEIRVKKAETFNRVDITEKVKEQFANTIIRKTDISTYSGTVESDYIGHRNKYVASFTSASATLTGAIKFISPFDKASIDRAFVRLTADVFEKDDVYSIESSIYSNETSPNWGAVVSNHSDTIKVSYGYENNKLVFIIGDENTVWKYPNVFISYDFSTLSSGGGGDATNLNLIGWSSSITNDLSSIANRVNYQHIPRQGDGTSLYTGNGALTSETTVTQGGNKLIFSGGDVAVTEKFGVNLTSPEAQFNILLPSTGTLGEHGLLLSKNNIASTDAFIRINSGTSNLANYLPVISMKPSYNAPNIIRGVQYDDAHTNDALRLQASNSTETGVISDDDVCFSFRNWSTELLKIYGSGDMAIGAITPTEKLDIEGKIRMRTLNIESTATKNLVALDDGTFGYQAIDNANYITLQHTNDDTDISETRSVFSFVVPASMDGKSITEISFLTETAVLNNAINVGLNRLSIGGTGTNTYGLTLAVGSRGVSQTGTFTINTNDKIRIDVPDIAGTAEADGLTATIRIQ
jgi:hypothetical protein